MNANTILSATSADDAADRADEIALLRAELETAAEIAEAKFEPLFSWLLELADRGRGAHVPRASPSARVLQEKLGVGFGVARHSVKLARQWIPRIHEVLGEAETFEFPDPRLAEARKSGAPVGPVSAELVEHLASEHELAPADERIFFQWLLERARIGLAPPAVGGVVRMTDVATAMGLPYWRTQKGAEIVRRWAPLFPDFGGEPQNPCRTQLPGCDAEGTDVPTETLVAALQAALSEYGEGDFGKLLRHLIALAQGDRTVPRGQRGANHLQTLRDAGIAEADLKRKPLIELREWIAFYHVSSDLTLRRRSDGSRIARERVEDTVAKWLATHVDEIGDPLPIKTNPKHPHGISWAWVSRETGVPRGQIDTDRPRVLIEERWKQLGPGPHWEGIPPAERRMKAARRQVLLKFVRECVDAGIPLPCKDGKLRTLDHDELVRRSASPGPNLADDLTFRKAVMKMKPKFEYVRDDGGIPSSYAQLIDGIQRKRLQSNKTEGSRAVTRSKIETAIGIFHRHLDKAATSPINEDFVEPRFTEILQEIIEAGKCGTNPDNWKSELRGAQRWLTERISDDMLGEDFHTVLAAAVKRDGRTVREIVTGLDLTEAQLSGFLNRTSRPTRDKIPELRKLALKLGLEESRLVSLAGHGLSLSKRDHGGYKPPKLVAEFMPDDWRSRPLEEQRAIGEWIDENLIHRNDINGHTMRVVAQRVLAEKAAKKALAAGEPAQAQGSAGSAQPELPAPSSERRTREDHLGRYIDRQLTVKSTGLPKRLVEELKVLRRHMTVDFPDEFLRRAGVRWAVESTAPMKLALLIRFFKWQIRSEEEDGLGRDPEHLTMADLLHPPIVFAYIDYKARAYEHVEVNGKKRGKVFTSSEGDLLRTIKSLVSREFGLITQRPELAARMVADDNPLPEGSFITLGGHVYSAKEREAIEKEEDGDAGDDDPGADFKPILPADLCGLEGADFIAACRRAELVYASAEFHVDEQAEMIRDPAEAIMPILDSPQPMATLLRQIALAGMREPNRDTHALQHHLHKRDLLIVRLLALTSLRSRNLREITIGQNGKLRFDANRGMWQLKISFREFKNYKNAVLFGRKKKRQPYVKWIKNTHGLYDLIDYYLNHSRPFFLKRAQQGARARKKPVKPTDRLFLTANGNKLDGQMMWKTVKMWTARHVAWNPFRENGVVLCQHFGPHAFRDIRATDILLHPETDNPFLEAALALQTSPTMIQNHYGIMRTEKRTELDDISFLKRENLAWAGLGLD